MRNLLPSQVVSATCLNFFKAVAGSYNNYSVSSSELVLSLGWEVLGVRRLYNQSVS